MLLTLKYKNADTKYVALIILDLIILFIFTSFLRCLSIISNLDVTTIIDVDNKI